MKVSVLNTCPCAERFEPPELFIIMTDDSTVGKLTVQLSKASMTLSTYSTTFIYITVTSLQRSLFALTRRKVHEFLNTANRA